MKTHLYVLDKPPADLDAFCKTHNLHDNERLLIQVFLGNPSQEAVKEIQRLLRERFPHAQVLGTTTDGAIMNAEAVTAGSTVLSFTQFDRTDLHSVLVKNENNDFKKTGERLAQALVREKTRAVIAFTEGLHTNGENFLLGFNQYAPEISIAGGMAGDNGRLRETFVFTANESTSDGAVGVALDNPNLSVYTRYSFNWIPIGKRMVVTKSRGNRVYEIDNKPAYDVYARYLGQEIARRLPASGIEFPLILDRPNATVGRAVTQTFSDGSLSFAGNIPQGEFVRFGVGNAELIRQNGVENAKKLNHHPIESVFIYSCMARRHFMGEEIESELLPLQALGPASGFFTYGEFFHSHKKTQLLNQSITLLALSESNEKRNAEIREAKLLGNTEQDRIKALAHLSNTVSREFENLNLRLQQRIQEKTNEILNQAYTDRLTGLPNRLKLIHSLHEAIGRYLVLIDIDNFTSLNDFFGFSVGDSILRSVADSIGSYLDGNRTDLYKLPSDGYAVVNHDIKSEGELLEWLEKFSTFMKQQIVEYDNQAVTISVTMGATRIEGAESLTHADLALKHAQRTRVDYLLYDEEKQFSKNIQKNLRMAELINAAVKDHRIVPYYQPIYDLKSGKISKYECLARMLCEDGTVLGPANFLEVAKKTRQYPEITRLMMEQALECQACTGHTLSLNIEIDDILNEETRRFLLDRLQHSDHSRTMIFEILENQEVLDDPIILNFIRDVKTLDGKIAIDDFGSGYANFYHMTRIAADIVKIDGTLIRNIHRDENTRIVVEAIVNFAHQLGMQTVAEFVHSAEVLEAVKRIGIDCAQGFYLGKPQPYPDPL
ncbi:EAL domain-containing protein [Nitratifractor sp.]|uniref:bifunctional diguanylate cyclase/phosphodiesterase n=1 Tax=Nitratifractor sp. TaxID=2268144 RepID=UPI0025E8313D|nr:EAL domain-containing protein [Nitratifractor sp.]